MTRKIAIFDTTLRDGEQSPGASMNSEEKLVITRQLLRLNVEVIEAGFPVSSPGDFKSVQQIAAEVGDRAVVCALSRAVEKDIDSAARALASASALVSILVLAFLTAIFTTSFVPRLKRFLSVPLLP